MLVTLVLLSVIQIYSAQESCAPIGTNDETRFSSVRDLRFYLNTANPAPCIGNITRWNYCYYGPPSLFHGSYRGTFAVYRRMLASNGSDVYQRVSNTFTIDRILLLDPIFPGFNCHNEFIAGGEVVELQMGDVLGACIFDPEDGLFSHSQLDVVGEASGYSLLEMNDVSECDFRAIPSRVSAPRLTERTSRILHLYAEIEPAPATPPATTTGFETSASTTTMTMQTDTTSNTVPPTTQVSVDTPVPTAMTTQDNIATSDIETMPITTTTSEVSETTTTAAPTTLPPTSETTTETTMEATTVTMGMIPITTTTEVSETTTTAAPTTLPPTSETTTETIIETTETTMEATTVTMGMIPITTTTSEVSETTTTAAPTTLPPTSELTTETIIETTTVTMETTSMKPQTDEVTEEPTSADLTTMTTTEAITVISRPTTDGIDTTDATTAIPTTFDQTTEIGITTPTSERLNTQADTTTSMSTMITNDLSTTDQPATANNDTTQKPTQSHITTSDLDDKTVTSQPVNPNTIGGTEQQISGSPSLGLIVGPIGAVVLLLISGAVIAIAVTLFRKRQKSVGRYSTSVRGIKHVNGVDNINYSTGFCNLTALEASSCTYDVPLDGGATSQKKLENHYDLAESTLSNTYEYVQGGIGTYSEVALPYATTSIESEYHYSSHDTYGISMYSLLEKNKEEDIYGDLDAFYEPATSENEIYSQLQSCGVRSIPHSQIKVLGHLGSGQFGNVEKGTWQSREVALKNLKEGSQEQDKVKFLQEAAIMAQFTHPNIVTLHGVVSDKEPLMLVVELMQRGDLRNYLHCLRPDPGELPVATLPETLLNFTQQVALGMYYLSAKGFVHRDLAARNILVSNDNTCKIADFGMSRDLADENYYISHGGVIPVKWTAPEAIHYKKYSTASDVWSYGCLLYEIWSLGYKPFEGTLNIEVVKIIDSKKRLSPPPGCPKVIYDLMIQCWNPVPSGRPTFRQLALSLSGTKDKLLFIPSEALSTHKLAGVLGSPIEAGRGMYADLQNQYLSDSNGDYESVYD